MHSEHTPEQALSAFWSKIDKDGPLPDPAIYGDIGQCWVWTGGLVHGYGRCRDGRAHRRSWVMANGPVPDGLSVLHRCDNKPCCRPEHLFIGTQQDNMADMRIKGRAVEPPLHQGEDNPRSKLTAALVRSCRLRNAAGESGRALAREHGVRQCTMNDALRRVTWRNVT